VTSQRARGFWFRPQLTAIFSRSKLKEYPINAVSTTPRGIAEILTVAAKASKNAESADNAFAGLAQLQHNDFIIEELKTHKGFINVAVLNRRAYGIRRQSQNMWSYPENIRCR
jgi:hypothetical protein